MNGDTKLETIVRSHRALVLLSFALALISLITAISTCFFSLKAKGQNIYFATTTDGKLIPLKPIEQPLMATSEVIDFGSKVISHTFSFDYVDYQREITANTGDFTDRAFMDIKQELMGNNGIINETLKNNWLVSTHVLAAPQVVKEGLIDDTKTYGWRLIYPVNMTFQNEKTIHTSNYSADVLIIRVDQKNNPKGIAVSRITLSQARS